MINMKKINSHLKVIHPTKTRVKMNNPMIEKEVLILGRCQRTARK